MLPRHHFRQEHGYDDWYGGEEGKRNQGGLDYGIICAFQDEAGHFRWLAIGNWMLQWDSVI